MMLGMRLHDFFVIHFIFAELTAAQEAAAAIGTSYVYANANAPC
jgi:hypothetical protein